MSNKSIITILAIATIIFAGAAYAVYQSKQDRVVPSKTTSNSTSESADLDSKFAQLKGDKFDEAYIADMLAHHEGAVNMAEQAQAVTAHEEIRTLAGNITRTQSLEMIEMRNWQKEWSYEVTNSGGHMSHSGGGMDMAGDMTEMMGKLQGLEGEAYDKEFLKQMIIHHEQAVEMSQYAETNAKHEEVKELARNIIAAQEAEIKQMKAWQKEWGYPQN